MRKISLNAQILAGVLAGLLLGLGLSLLGKESTAAQAGLYIAELVGTLFIDLLKMVMIPLVFTSIAVGVANLRAHRPCRDFEPSKWRYPIFSLTSCIRYSRIQ